MKHTKPLIQQIPIEQLQRGRFQPRRHFDQETLQELADSIRINGLIQPIVVRPISSSRYEIIAGERRWRAVQLAGFDEVSCLIKAYNDEQAAAVTAVENMQREDLNPIEEAQALQRLIDEFGYLHEEVAAVICASRTKVTNLLRLLQLTEPVQRLLISGQLSEGHGKILAALSPQLQLSLAQQAVQQAWSVRKMEQMVKRASHPHIASPHKNANIKRLERIVSDQFGSKVELETDAEAQGGWLKIKFYDNQTLAGLLQKMGINHEDEGP